ERVNVLALPVVGAQSHDISFVRNDIDEFKLPEEPPQGGIAFTLFLPHLDREGKVFIVAVGEAHDRVSNPWRAPVSNKDVDTANGGEVNDTGLPARCVICLGPIDGVSD